MSKEEKNQPRQEGWKVLIVDDERMVHPNLRMALREMKYEGNKLSLISAYSAREAEEIFREQTDIAVIILDVMMERDDAGLRLVDIIRNEIGNKQVQIILHTGQLDILPKRKISERYMIDSYLQKGNIDNEDCYVAVHLSLKAYQNQLELLRSKESDDVDMLRDIADIYSGLLEMSAEERTYKVFIEELNKATHLVRSMLAFYVLQDTKGQKPERTTMRSRLSGDEYDALIVVFDVKILLTYTPIRQYKDQREHLFDKFVADMLVRFSEIRLLPEASKKRLRPLVEKHLATVDLEALRLREFF